VAVTPPRFAIVVPTVGRQSLAMLLQTLAAAEGPLPERLVIVDDRPAPGPRPEVPARLSDATTFQHSGGRGPAAARNVGWRFVAAGETALSDSQPMWIAFLDDDVLVTPTWLQDLADDVATAPPEVAGIQGVISVPLPTHRRPTDWERNTAGLQTSAWITADMAYRLDALTRTDGFDERFRRAFREDADLALRVKALGFRLVPGQRKTCHPVREADRWVSVRMQAGNADDVLMARLHGTQWRELAAAPRGARSQHLAVTAAGVAAACALLARHPRVAAVAGLGWVGGTTRFAWSRIGPGPRTRREVRRMVLTSIAIPPAATFHWLRGQWQHRQVAPQTGPGHPAKAVLFDRDGTLIHDVPYNGDPALVAPMPGAVEAVQRLRARGVRVGVITNQSGIGRGSLTENDVRRVNARVDEIFGAFDVWETCPHLPQDSCSCRKPAPGMVLAAADHLGVPPRDIVVIGDIGSDVEAAQAAGARGVLVPTPATRPEEVRRASEVATDITEAVRLAVGAAS
jgi:HAD superfamily hydrolase (TIGR01662 family)